MGDQQDRLHDITEIRSMMERSTRFLSLSGLAGVFAGIYALAGAFIAYFHLGFRPVDQLRASSDMTHVIALGLIVLVLALGTAVILSQRRADQRGERSWNATSRRLLVNVALPLSTGGILMLIFLAHGLVAYLAPLSLIFYGLGIFSAGNFTYNDVRVMGTIQVLLGLLGCYIAEFGLLLWAVGFGLVHIAYGIHIHFKYER